MPPRNAHAGVNTDEEMTNMVEYQVAYEASAENLHAQRMTYRTALAAAAKTIQPSLAAFLQ